MRKQPAAWLLTLLVALGAGQAVPVSSLQRSPETSAIVQLVKGRREQHVRRGSATRSYTPQDSGAFYSNDSLTVTRHFWNARLLRAPPLSSIA